MVVSSKKSVFTWEGINKQGYHLRGEYEADNKNQVKAKLASLELTSLSITKKTSASSRGKKTVIKPYDIAIFCRQLSTMISAGVPLVQSLDIINQGQEKIKMKKVLTSVSANIADGKSLADSLRIHKEHFDELFCNLVAVGEESGKLDTMLEQIAQYKEKTEETKKKIKKALFYPSAIVTIAIMVTAILLVFVVPQFEELFTNFGQELPLFTRMVLKASDFIRDNWWLVACAIIAGAFIFKTMKKKSPAFAYFLDKSLLSVLIIGTIIRKAIIARITRTLGITLASGVPPVSAFNSIAGITGSLVYRDAIFQIRDDVASGQNIHKSIQQTGLFPSMVVQMIAIGEQSGMLEEILTKIALFYEEDVNNAVDGLSSLLEPLIMLFLGVIIGGLVAAMYLPIFKLGSLF